MKILHLSHTDITSDSRILKEMTSLLKLGSNHYICGIGTKDINSRTIEINPSLKIICLDLVIKKTKLLRPLRIFLTYIELFFTMLKGAVKTKPDIIHCHDVFVLPVAVFAKWFTGAELIYDAHELESEMFHGNKKAGKVVLLIEKILWRAIDALIVVSPSIEKWYYDNLGKKKSEVILNSPIVNPGTPTVSTQYLREKFNIPADQKIFLYVGLLTGGRGLDLILNVFERSDVKSHMVFLGYGDLSDTLKNAEKKNPKIHVHDAVSHYRVTEIAASADFGLCLVQNVSLSDYYCLPNKLFEYSFAGVKVLASNFPEISNVVKKYNLGECVELDQQDIYKAVLKLENEAITSKEVDENIYKDLSWRAQELKLLNLYNTLLIA